MTFGSTLRSWREERGFSQLRLATAAEVSQRHISFLENGRAKPSREMVTHLGRTLRVPLRDQNQLLLEAGFAPQYSERPMEALDDVGEAIQFLLRAHEPNMAVVIDHAWNLVFANDPAARFTADLLPDPPLFEGRLNLMYALLHPRGFGPFIANRAEVEPMMLWRLADDLNQRPTDPDLQSLDSAVRSLATVSAAAFPEHAGLVGTVRFRIGDRIASMFSCLTRLENTADVTLDGLRIETFFPADPDSAAVWQDYVADTAEVPDAGRTG